MSKLTKEQYLALVGMAKQHYEDKIPPRRRHWKDDIGHFAGATIIPFLSGLLISSILIFIHWIVT